MSEKDEIAERMARAFNIRNDLTGPEIIQLLEDIGWRHESDIWNGLTDGQRQAVSDYKRFCGDEDD